MKRNIYMIMLLSAALWCYLQGYFNRQEEGDLYVFQGADLERLVMFFVTS